MVGGSLQVLPATSTTKTGWHDIVEILLKVAFKHHKSNQSITLVSGKLVNCICLRLGLLQMMYIQNCFFFITFTILPETSERTPEEVCLLVHSSVYLYYWELFLERLYTNTQFKSKYISKTILIVLPHWNNSSRMAPHIYLIPSHPVCVLPP